MANLKSLFPGTKVPLTEDIEATVYPLGVKHIKVVSLRVSAIMRVLAAIPVKEGSSSEEKLYTALPTVLPILVQEFLDVISDCVVIKDAEGEIVEGSIEDLPHHMLPPILTVWVEDSFTEGKIEIWKTSLEQAYERTTGKVLSISEMLSKRSSEPVIQE